MKKRYIAGIILLVVLLAAGLGIGLYVNDYYHASTDAMKLAEESREELKPEGELVSDTLIFEAEDPVAGLIFYPGGKVQYEAYAPLMEALSERGIYCILLHMPANLAVLDMNAADGIIEQYPEIKNWYMAGHSLGGAMAASYISKHVDEYAGLILMGAYSTEDLSESGLQVLSIYGSEDGVLSREKYEEDRSNLPEDFKELVIQGGCHAYFGDYGFQEGDGTPSITQEEQITQTADFICQEIVR